VTIHTGTARQQMDAMVEAIRTLSAEIERQYALADSEPDARAEHLQRVAAASSSMRNAAWSLMNMAMDQAKKGAK
jgi:hypothetical protein